MTGQRVVLIGGAATSLGLMLYAGRSNTHLVITLLFIAWVAAPFVLLWFAQHRSTTWSPATKTTLRILTIVVALGSITIYGYRAAFPPRSTGAFLFVIVPPVTVVLILTSLALASLMARRSGKESTTL